MIFDLSRGFVPEVYSDSRDFRVFLRQLGILVSVFKDSIDSFTSLYSADDCPDDILPILAEMVGYTYDSSLSIEKNRIIIKYFPKMLRYRGSEEGFKIAMALSLNTSDQAGTAYPSESVLIETDYDTGEIKIYYPSLDLIKKDLINKVRPVGTYVTTIESSLKSSTDVLDFKVVASAETEENAESRHQVGTSKVGFGDVKVEEDKS